MAKALKVYGDRAERPPHRETLQRVRSYVLEESREDAGSVAYALGLTCEMDMELIQAQANLMALINLEYERRSPGRFSQEETRNLWTQVLPSLWECIQE